MEWNNHENSMTPERKRPSFPRHQCLDPPSDQTGGPAPTPPTAWPTLPAIKQNRVRCCYRNSKHKIEYPNQIIFLSAKPVETKIPAGYPAKKKLNEIDRTQTEGKGRDPCKQGDIISIR